MPYNDWPIWKQVGFAESALGAILIILAAYSVAGIVVGLALHDAALAAWSSCPIIALGVLSLTYRHIARWH